PRGIPYLKAGPPTILIYSGVDGSLIRVLDLSRYLGASFLSGFSVAGGDVAPESGEEIIVGVGVVGVSGVLVLNGQGDLLRSFNTFTRYQTKGEIWVAAGNIISEEIGAGGAAPKDYDEIIVGSGQWSTGKSIFEIHDALGNYKTQEEVYAIGCGVRPTVANNPRGALVSVTGGPTITLSTDASSYTAGSSVLHVSYAIQKGTFPYTHTGDLFFWAEVPGGLRFYLTGRGSWSRAAVPVYRNVTLRQTPMRSLFSFPVPPNVMPGSYALSAALYRPPQGTLRDLFSNIARVDFSVAR
ncbi:MAG: hypothetical protein NTX71_02355, partial [Candidatus Aureabacteria bacterium]|nr:hypothetical protein [Candidatus Auribacterota bacterium]